MAERIDRAEKALWRRWRLAAGNSPAGHAAPDALDLAAYAEHRLAAASVESLEEWLAADPEVLADVLAAQEAAGEAFAPAPPAVTARLAGLIVADDGRVVPLRRPAPAPLWRRAAGWGAIAACLVVTSLVGFSLGNDAYLALAAPASPALAQELLDPPSGLFNALDEDSRT